MRSKNGSTCLGHANDILEASGLKGWSVAIDDAITAAQVIIWFPIGISASKALTTLADAYLADVIYDTETQSIEFQSNPHYRFSARDFAVPQQR